MTNELRVWCVLVDASNTELSAATKVTMDRSNDIDDFRHVVQKKYERTHLNGVEPTDLVVKKSKMNPVSLKSSEGLLKKKRTESNEDGDSEEMTQYGLNEDEALLVVVPTKSFLEYPHKKQRVDVDAVQVSETLPVPAPVLPPEPAPELPQIDISGSYVIIPGALLQPASIGSNSDILLYRRAQVDELWQFLNDQVIADKKIGYIVGPPGTGKSMCTLSFLASLDRTQWRVIWIHLTKKLCSTFLDLGTNKSWLFVPSKFEFPDYLDGQNNLFVCLDGLNNFQGYDEVFCLIQKRLGQHGSNRFVVCSSMATLGKRNREDDKHAGIKFFYMYSWTRDEYREAVNNRDFSTW